VNDYFKIADALDVPASARDPELEDLVVAHPWLVTLEPYSIEWELIWFM